MYKPTEKQFKAIKNMEKAISLSYEETRDTFPTQKDFQDYFSFLQERIKKMIKNINFNNAAKKGYIDFKKIKENKEEYYRKNINKLKEVVQKYVYKYEPSNKKALIYIQKKIGKGYKEIEDEVLSFLNINDKELLKKKIMIEYQNIKDITYIKNKMLGKLYCKDDILEILGGIKIEVTEIKPIDFSDKIKEKILKYYREGKGFYKILSLIRNTGHENAINFLNEIEEEKGFDFTYIAFQKIKQRENDSQKIIKKLQNQGFKYDKIKKCFPF